MGRQGLKRSLENFQWKLLGWPRPEDQCSTSGSHTSESQKQILTNPRPDAPIKGLWSIAYEKLRAEDGALIREYEKQLQGQYGRRARLDVKRKYERPNADGPGVQNKQSKCKYMKVKIQEL